LYSVDDLGVVVQTGADSRRAAVVQAEAIIDTRVSNFMHWMQVRANVPIIRDLQATAQAVQAQEIERATRLLAKGESPEAVMEQLARSLTQKYLHGTLTALNQGEDIDREHLLALIPRIFPSGNERR
ncbi:MAG: glutamyl-tRNA reductase, partial [Burkholderiales bacterium]